MRTLRQDAATGRAYPFFPSAFLYSNGLSAKSTTSMMEWGSLNKYRSFTRNTRPSSNSRSVYSHLLVRSRVNTLPVCVGKNQDPRVFCGHQLFFPVRCRTVTVTLRIFIRRWLAKLSYMVAKLCRRRAQHVDADPDRQVSRIFRLLVKMQHGIIGSPHTVGVGKLDEIQVADPVPVNIQTP